MTKGEIIIAPSILGVDENRLEIEFDSIKEAGAKWVHVDIMDGKFVDHVFGSLDRFKRLATCHDLFNDVHIMVNDPKSYIKEYVEAGANNLTFHYEACKDEKEVNEVIDLIHASGIKAGISIKPNTDVEVLLPFIKKVDLVLIMTVEPGKGGQDFMRENLSKVRYLRSLRDDLLIEVDGGINDKTAKECVEAGVNVLVSGSFVFGGNVKERIQTLINAVK